MTVTIDPQGNLDLAPRVMSQELTDIAIIGTRHPDRNQVEVATNLARIFSFKCKVRTGGAYGIDQAAMVGTGGYNLEVYLPWSGYNLHIIPTNGHIIVYDPRVHTAWTDSVYRFHPSPPNLSHGGICLHARNFGIVSGIRGLLAFPNEKGEGGTGQGIRIAKALGIQTIIFNKGSIIDVPRTMAKIMQSLDLADPNLKPMLPGGK